jgi:hypothetical protein
MARVGTSPCLLVRLVSYYSVRPPDIGCSDPLAGKVEMPGCTYAHKPQISVPSKCHAPCQATGQRAVSPRTNSTTHGLYRCTNSEGKKWARHAGVGACKKGRASQIQRQQDNFFNLSREHLLLFSKSMKCTLLCTFFPFKLALVEPRGGPCRNQHLRQKGTARCKKVALPSLPAHQPNKEGTRA